MVEKKDSNKKKGIDLGNKNFIIGLVVVVLVICVGLYFGLKKDVLFAPEDEEGYDEMMKEAIGEDGGNDVTWWDGLLNEFYDTIIGEEDYEIETYEGGCVDTGEYCEDSVCVSCDDVCLEYGDNFEEEMFEEGFEDGGDLEYEESLGYEDNPEDEEEISPEKIGITGNSVSSILNFEQAVACCGCGQGYSSMARGIPCFNFNHRDCTYRKEPICKSYNKCGKCFSDSECSDAFPGELFACVGGLEHKEHPELGACKECIEDFHCKDNGYKEIHRFSGFKRFVL